MYCSIVASSCRYRGKFLKNEFFSVSFGPAGSLPAFLPSASALLLHAGLAAPRLHLLADGRPRQQRGALGLRPRLPTHRQRHRHVPPHAAGLPRLELRCPGVSRFVSPQRRPFDFGRTISQSGRRSTSKGLCLSRM